MKTMRENIHFKIVYYNCLYICLIWFGWFGQFDGFVISFSKNIRCPIRELRSGNTSDGLMEWKQKV